MGIRIEWASADRLQVTGDIEGELLLPPVGEDRLFVLACSDGTMIEGVYGAAGDCLFRIAREGAGMVRIAGDDRHAFDLDWLVEWIMIAPIGAALVASGRSEVLPLFPDLGRGGQQGEQLLEPLDD